MNIYLIKDRSYFLWAIGKVGKRMMSLKSARVSYPYGVRNSVYGKGYHEGIDLVSENRAIYAAVAGAVIKAAYAGGQGADPEGWGNYVILRTRNGNYDLIHAHLASVKVTRGQTVNEGAILGMMGRTGNTTGPHLHFEVRRAPWTNNNEINPAVFLGIENKEGPVKSVSANSSEEGKKVVQNIILCNPGPDERAAAYLADHLKAPVCYLANVTKEFIDCAEKVYVIGNDYQAAEKSINIIGADRYDTCQKVLDLCKAK